MFPDPPPPEVPYEVQAHRLRGRPDNGYLHRKPEVYYTEPEPAAGTADEEGGEEGGAGEDGSGPKSVVDVLTDFQAHSQKIAAENTAFKEAHDLANVLCEAVVAIGPAAHEFPEVIAARDAVQAAINARSAVADGEKEGKAPAPPADGEPEAGGFTFADEILLPPIIPLLQAAKKACDHASDVTPARVIRHPEARAAWADQHGALASVSWPVYVAGLMAYIGSLDDTTATQFLLERIQSPTGNARLQ